MSNVRGFNDYPDESGGRNNRPRGQNQSLAFMGYNTTPDSQPIKPRDESMIQMFYYACCPGLTWISFTTFITLVDIIMFIITLCAGGITSGNPSTAAQFLQVNPMTLYYFGDRYPYYMRYEYQIWRFITPVFLHAYFLHIFFNMCSQLIFGSLVEGMVKSLWKVVALYFLADFGGNLFGALVSDTPAVGASTAIAGLLGVYMAYIIVNWKKMDYDGSPRDMMICMAFMIIMFDILFSMSMTGNEVDNYGHLGGLFTGITGGMWLVEVMDKQPGPYERTVSKAGWITMFAYFILGITLFYTIRHPSI